MDEFKPLRPGQIPMADQLNELAREVRRQRRVTASPPFEVLRAGDGVHFRRNDADAILVRITGKTQDDPYATPPGFCYSGIEQLDAPDAAIADLAAGDSFTADSFPLVESSGNTGVATNTVVRAFPGSGGGHYVFDAPAASVAVKLFRIQTYFIVDTNPPVSSPSPLCFYPVIETIPTIAGGWADGTFIAWLVTPFNYAVWGAVALGAPFTVMRADGQGYTAGEPTGDTYAPNDNGVHPYSGDSRPVYKWTKYDAAWGLTCGSVDGVSMIQPVLG